MTLPNYFACAAHLRSPALCESAPSSGVYTPPAVVADRGAALPGNDAFFASRYSDSLLTAAQARRPVVPRINAQTMISSFRLSRWKQVAIVSLSSASLQIGRLWDRQNARVHWLHEADAERAANISASGRRSILRGGDEDDDSGPSLMRVLFLKQVHLQKVGAATADGH